MSIEKLFGDLTSALTAQTSANAGVADAINKLADVMASAIKATTTAPAQTGDAQPVTDAKVKAPKSQPAASTAAAASQPSEAPAAETALRRGSPVTTPAPASEPEPEVTYPEVVKALVALNEATNRETALEALSRFGVTNAKQLKPEQYKAAQALFIKTLADVKAA